MGRRVEQKQLPRALHDDGAGGRASKNIGDMRRGAGRNLGDDLVRSRIEHLYGIDAGYSEIQGFAVVAELEVARRLLQCHIAYRRARRHVHHDQRELPRLLRSRVGELAVGRDSDGMWLRHGSRADNLLGSGIDKRDAVFSVHADQKHTAVGRHRKPMRRVADFDRLGDLIGRGVDDTHGRRALAADIDPPAVRRYAHAMRSLGDGYRGYDRACRRVDDADRVVLEIADVGFGAGSGGGQREPQR